MIIRQKALEAEYPIVSVVDITQLEDRILESRGSFEG